MLSTAASRGLCSGSRQGVCLSVSAAQSVSPAPGPPTPLGTVRSQLGVSANEGSGTPRPPAGARVCGVWARGRLRRGRHKCTGRARRAPEAVAEATPGSTSRASRSAHKSWAEADFAGRRDGIPVDSGGPSRLSGPRPA